MLLVISPAKTLDYQTPPTTTHYTIPTYLDRSQQLIERARHYSAHDLVELMEVSMAIAELNVARFAAWHTPFTPQNAKQALFAFKGEVYHGLRAETLDEPALLFAQQHLRILSGLYGLLRPLDLMQPYRLEMGRPVATALGRNLYEFWGTLLTEGLNAQLKAINSAYLINLASAEYFKAVKPKLLSGTLITPEFKEKKNGEYKMVGVYAKKARGLMSRFVIDNRLTDPQGLKRFDVDGYTFNGKLSTATIWVFTRG
ncbi:MAG TPA: peroxide stress protein YaaA [Gammaproteobacteria bacterium]